MCSIAASFIGRASCMAITLKFIGELNQETKAMLEKGINGGEQGKGEEHFEGDSLLASIVTITF